MGRCRICQSEIDGSYWFFLAAATGPGNAGYRNADVSTGYPSDSFSHGPRGLCAHRAKFAEHFGVDREYALVMMADYVVPD